MRQFKRQFNMECLKYMALRANEAVGSFHIKPHKMGLEWKEDDTPVTVADRAVRDLVASFMTTNFPRIPVIGEEGQLGARTGADDEEWLLVDEVDGTWAYMLGVPVFSSLFAFMRGNMPVMSAICDPIGDKVYYAERGSGAYVDAPLSEPRLRRISVHAEMPKVPTIGYASWPYKNHPSDMIVRGLVRDVVVGIHDMGCIPVNMVTNGYFDAQVACGKFSATVFPARTLQDTAAGHLLVEEAGGIATDLLGNELNYGGKQVMGHIFAANADLHESLVQMVVRSMKLHE